MRALLNHHIIHVLTKRAEEGFRLFQANMTSAFSIWHHIMAQLSSSNNLLLLAIYRHLCLLRRHNVGGEDDLEGSPKFLKFLGQVRLEQGFGRANAR
jgi:hypothetical protein